MIIFLLYQARGGYIFFYLRPIFPLLIRAPANLYRLFEVSKQTQIKTHCIQRTFIFTVRCCLDCLHEWTLCYRGVLGMSEQIFLISEKTTGNRKFSCLVPRALVHSSLLRLPDLTLFEGSCILLCFDTFFFFYLECIRIKLKYWYFKSNMKR